MLYLRSSRVWRRRNGVSSSLGPLWRQYSQQWLPHVGGPHWAFRHERGHCAATALSRSVPCNNEARRMVPVTLIRPALSRGLWEERRRAIEQQPLSRGLLEAVCRRAPPPFTYGSCSPHTRCRGIARHARVLFASAFSGVSRALRGGSGKEEPLPKSTTLGAPPLPPRALQAAPGNDGLAPTQPPVAGGEARIPSRAPTA